MGYPHKPHAKETVVLSKHFGDPEPRTYKDWVRRAGWFERSAAGKGWNGGGVRTNQNAPAPGGGRLQRRGRDGVEKLERGKARHPADQTAVPGRLRRVRHAYHDQQRGDPRRRPAH